MLHIVDDEDVIRDALAWLAQSRGMAARGYPGGQEFLNAIAEPDPAGDCVLLDVLNNLKCDQVNIALGDSNSSALISIPDNGDFKYVVMPMRI